MCITKFSASTSGHDRESCKFNSIVSEITHTLSFRDGFDSWFTGAEAMERAQHPNTSQQILLSYKMEKKEFGSSKKQIKKDKKENDDITSLLATLQSANESNGELIACCILFSSSLVDVYHFENFLAEQIQVISIMTTTTTNGKQKLELAL